MRPKRDCTRYRDTTSVLSVSKKGGLFYCPHEAIDLRDRGQRMLEWSQITLKVTDQRRSAIRAGPAESDKAHYGAHGLALFTEIRP